MKKIKNLESIRLTPESESAINGGCSCNNMLSSNWSNPACCSASAMHKIPTTTKPIVINRPPSGPTCFDCAGCIVEDGGSGFALGMNWQSK